MNGTSSPPLSLPSYQYTQLDHSIKETRLAELLPGSYDDELYLRIHSIALSSSNGSYPNRSGFSVDDLQKDLPDDWIVRETINGRFIFERKRDYKPEEPYETSWIHPKAKFKPFPNNYNLLHTKPEYEALSHVWGPEDDQTIVNIVACASVSKESSKEHRNAANGWPAEPSQDAGAKRAADDDTIFPSAKRNNSTLISRNTWPSTASSQNSDGSKSNTHDDLERAVSALLIRTELAIALRHLRFKSRSRMLWVDNICINQNDTSERSHLVRHMGQVYRLAQRVIVWLGPEQNNSQLAMAKLDYLGHQAEITNKGSWRVNAPGCPKPTWSRTAVALPYDNETWEAITSLLQRPWFKRLWVWQEAKLSNDESIIQCGQKTMELYRFGVAAWCAAAKSSSIPAGLQVPLFRAGDAVLRQFDEPFLNTLLHLNGKECSDPRDKIYGALGLAPPPIADNIAPDYEKEVEDVYKDAAAALCQATGRADFLMACNLASRTLSGPTWAPDWSVTQRRTPRWLLSTTLASGISVAEAEVILAPRPTLLVHGVEWGTVTSIGQRAPDGNEEPDTLASVIRSWAPTFLNDEMYITRTESLLDAFVKTVHWNTLRERCPLDNSLLTLAEAKEALQQVLSAPQNQNNEDSEISQGNGPYRHRYTEARGRSFIELHNGYIGMTSAVAQETDIVCVILGCPLPMILRPHSSGRFHVVGPTYIHGLMDAEGLLGPLKSEFVVQVGASSGWYGGSTFRNVVTGEIMEEDPRLGDLPPSWVRTEAVRMSTDPLHFLRFRSLATGKTINGDPRLLPEALRARGVPLEPLNLV